MKKLKITYRTRRMKRHVQFECTDTIQVTNNSPEEHIFNQKTEKIRDLLFRIPTNMHNERVEVAKMRLFNLLNKCHKWG